MRFGFELTKRAAKTFGYGLRAYCKGFVILTGGGAVLGTAKGLYFNTGDSFLLRNDEVLSHTFQGAFKGADIALIPLEFTLGLGMSIYSKCRDYRGRS
jgi:hypothetical protein